MGDRTGVTGAVDHDETGHALGAEGVGVAGVAVGDGGAAGEAEVGEEVETGLALGAEGVGGTLGAVVDELGTRQAGVVGG